MVLKFYVNRKLISSDASVIPLLFPFLGQVYKPKMLFWNEVFAKHGFDKRYYCLTNEIGRADAVVIPHHYGFLARSDPKRLNSLISEAVLAKKPILAEATGDFSGEVEVPRVIVIRNSRPRSELKANDIIMPAYAEDLLDRYFGGRISPRPKGLRPAVGFVGWGEISPRRFPKLYLDYLWKSHFGINDNFQKGIFIRVRALQVIAAQSGIQTNFILRPSYSGHRDTISLNPEMARREFVENIWSTDYTLCVRGETNYSIRFYETLSLGRIPLYIDTDAVLPLGEQIKYRDVITAIKLSELANLGEILLAEYKKMSQEEFKSRQRKAREIYRRYLRLDSFTPFLMKEVQKRLI